MFSHVPWDVIDFDADIDQCWLQWKDQILAAIYQVIPSVKWSKQKLKHWFSHSTIELIHKKRRLYRAYKSNPTSTLHEKHKKISNVVRQCCRDDTIKHSVSVSGDYHSNPKRFWHWINSRPEPIMLKILPIILSRISQKILLSLFLLFLHPAYYSIIILIQYISVASCLVFKMLL